MNSKSQCGEIIERRRKLRLRSGGLVLIAGVATLICAAGVQLTVLAIIGVALTGLASRIPAKRRRNS